MRTKWTIVLTVGVMAVLGSMAQADMTAVFSNSYGSTNGGEFLITPTDFKLGGQSFAPANLGQAPGQFETFCLERNENISYGKKYYVSFSTAAINGGVSGGNPDPLDPKTARLYELFITQSLTGYNYGTGSARVASADALQNLIWGLEGEWGVGWTPAGLSGLQKTFYDQVKNYQGGLSDVRVMNVYADANRTQCAQDQLVMVPAPTAVGLGLLGVAIAGYIRRRQA